MNANTFGILWLCLGLFGIVLFVISEIKTGSIEITLSTIFKIPMLIIAGPLTVALYIYVWGDNVVIWKSKKH